MMLFLRKLLMQAGLLNFARRIYGFLNGVKISFSGENIHIRKDSREIRTHQSIYVTDLVRFFDSYYSAVVPVEENGVQFVDYTGPRLHRLKRSGVELEFPSLAESEDAVADYLAALDLKPGDVVFDLGAYAGATTYFFSKAVGPTGLVLALEPDKSSFQFLDRNVRRHHLENVKCLATGIWSETTTLKFSSSGTLASAVSTNGKAAGTLVEISVVTLNDLLAMAGGRPVAGIKMDIEGAELDVLRSESAKSFFARQRPRIIIEPHLVDGKFATDEVCQLLRSYNYEISFFQQGLNGVWPLVAGKPRL
jgi:FkbM family methyltransferase